MKTLGPCSDLNQRREKDTQHFARIAIAIIFFTLFTSVFVASADREGTDPYLWLEEIDGSKALEWVHKQNERTAEALKKNAIFPSLYQDALNALNSESRVPEVTQIKGYLYNLWKDEQHERGIYRRTTLSEFKKENPQWETVLDVDALSAKEGKKWVFKGMSCLPDEYRKCLVFLSPGGGDAVEVREWDMQKLAFVADGFFLPEAKSIVSWIDENTLYLGTDFGEGSLTESGYPRIAKVWNRGTPVSEAKTLYEAKPTSVAVTASRLRTKEGNVDVLDDSLTFWTTRYYLLNNFQPSLLDLPETAVLEGAFRGKLVVSLKEDWTRNGKTYREGSVLIASPDSLQATEGKEIEVLIEPDPKAIVEEVVTSKAGIFVTMLEDVIGRMYRYEITVDGWKRERIPFPDHGKLELSSIDDDTGAFFALYESFTVPSTLYYVSGPDWKPERIKSQTPTFDGSKFEVRQYRATSKDGTKIPYFAVMSKEAKMDGKNPTHIFSYGGFRNSLTPSYSGSYEHLSGAYGKMWLERGGVFVLANIRGGGEFGPSWHAAALKENRHKAFEDFEAVAEDLVLRKISSPERIGIEGRSNGGLLVTATMVRHPELYGAIVCGSPLADMKRYHKLLAGASWMAEYGDPDIPEEWAYIKAYSPYQNLQTGKNYPPIFFYTSTRDDRVHPGHARKMAAKMQDMGYTAYYYENTEGGHGGSSTNEQLAYRLALAYTHLWNVLGSADSRNN